MRSLALLAVVFSLLLMPLGLGAQTVPVPVPNAVEVPIVAEAPDAAQVPSAAEAARTLAAVLRDPDARAALLAQLEAAAAADPGAAPTVPAEGEAPESAVVRVIADQTLGIAEAAAAGAVALVTALRDMEAIRAEFVAINWERSVRTIGEVAIIVVVTIAIYNAARRVFQGVPARLTGGGDTAARSIPRKLLGLFLVAVFELLLMLLAWSAGYGLALAIGSGAMNLRQSLFLNAFLVVEISRLVLRMVLSPRRPALRIPAIGDAAAKEWYLRPGRIISLLGYGLLVAVPISSRAVSRDFSALLEVVVVLSAAWATVRFVVSNRQRVRSKLLARSATARPESIRGRSLAALAHIWHMLAIAYVAALLVVWSIRPADSFGFMVAATLQSLVAILLGLLIMVSISRLAGEGITLSNDLKVRLPTLEMRLNRIVPNILTVARVLVFLAVFGLIFQAWEIFDYGAWLATERGFALVQGLFAAILILLAALVVWLAVSSWIEYKLNPATNRVVSARERTLLSLMRNAFTILMVVMTAMLALSTLGVNIAPLLAGAGVVGLAVGFGSQKLVQDIITGAFIQVENAMNTGDVVTAGGITGVVEKLTIRSVGLRTLDGTYHLIPFSSVDTVSNLMKDFSYHVAEIGVAYRENVAEVKALMEEAFQFLLKTEHAPMIIGPLDVQGLVAFGESAVMVRARIMTLPGKQWDCGHVYNELLKEVFDRAGVEFAFRHLRIYMGQDKRGEAPPLNLRPIAEAPRAFARTGGADPAAQSG